MPHFTLPDLCDAHADCIRIAEPMFHNYGDKAALPILMARLLMLTYCHNY